MLTPTQSKNTPSKQGGKTRLFMVALVTLALAVVSTSCRHEKPNVVYMPDMVYSPAVKAQTFGQMRMPVPGTISRNFEPYPYPHDAEKAGRELKNPLIPTKKVLLRGKRVYQINCLPCHGNEGFGDGPVVPKFPRPLSLQSDKVRNFTDGRIYHTVTMGQNLMPSYASEVDSSDRWAVIHYIRVLQRSRNPTQQDLKVIQEQEKQ